MEKKVIKYEHVHRCFGYKPTWKDIKDIDFQDDDLVHVGYDEGYYSESNSWDAHWFVIVERHREETDEEYLERKKRNEARQKDLKDSRYKAYLKLKEEFEVPVCNPGETG